jgi:hypothetical protein
MKLVKIILSGVILSIGGLILPQPTNAETDIEGVERRIKNLENDVLTCVSRLRELEVIGPPGPDAPEELWQQYQQELKKVEECTARLEREIKEARKLLADLLNRLPTSVTDGETRRHIEEISEKEKEWRKRVDKSEEKRKELLARLRSLQKNRK